MGVIDPRASNSVKNILKGRKVKNDFLPTFLRILLKGEVHFQEGPRGEPYVFGNGGSRRMLFSLPDNLNATFMICWSPEMFIHRKQLSYPQINKIW